MSLPRMLSRLVVNGGWTSTLTAAPLTVALLAASGSPARAQDAVVPCNSDADCANVVNGQCDPASQTCVSVDMSGDDQPPDDVIATLVPVYWGGYTCYWWNGRWVFRGQGGGWAHFRQAPRVLVQRQVNVRPVVRNYGRGAVYRGGPVRGGGGVPRGGGRR